MAARLKATDKQAIVDAVNAGKFTRVQIAEIMGWTVGKNGRCSNVDRIFSELQPPAATGIALIHAALAEDSTVNTAKVATAKGIHPPAAANWKAAKQTVKAAGRSDLHTACYREAKKANGGRTLSREQQAQTWIDAAELLG